MVAGDGDSRILETLVVPLYRLSDPVSSSTRIMLRPDRGTASLQGILLTAPKIIRSGLSFTVSILTSCRPGLGPERRMQMRFCSTRSEARKTLLPLPATSFPFGGSVQSWSKHSETWRGCGLSSRLSSPLFTDLLGLENLAGLVWPSLSPVLSMLAIVLRGEPEPALD